MENVAQAIHLGEIAQVALTVTDIAGATAFYRDVLGIQFLFDAGGMAFFQCGGVRLMLSTSGIPDKPFNPGGTILYFRVAEMESACAALRSSGVEFVQQSHLVARMKSHDLWLAFIKDPAGNTLGLMSEVARS